VILGQNNKLEYEHQLAIFLISRISCGHVKDLFCNILFHKWLFNFREVLTISHGNMPLSQILATAMLLPNLELMLIIQHSNQF
jgi:hypothetical protein